jgi:DNA-binding transcriptional MerR regulator
MKAASVQEIKQELKHLPAAELVDLLQRLSRFKKENKELLTYLLFEAHDESGFIDSVKSAMEEGFEAINTSQVYLAKKTIRKVLRLTNKYIRFSGSKTVEAELMIHFCALMKETGLPLKKYPVLTNLYEGQRIKAEKAIDALHEDIQYELKRKMVQLSD